MANSKTIELDYPFEHEGREIKFLTFRRMKAKDALIAEGIESPVEAGNALFAALAGVDVAVIGELDMDDYEKVAEAVAPLMGKSAAKASAESGQPQT